MKLLLKLAVALLLVVLFISCRREAELLNREGYKDYSFGNIAPVFVDDVPGEYISVNEVLDKYKDVFVITFFESQVCILTDEENLFQTSIANHEFLIQCKDDLYVNELKLKELVDSVKSSNPDL